METEAKPGRPASRKVQAYIRVTLKMWRHKKEYERYQEEVRRRRLGLTGGELAFAHRMLSLSENAPRPANGGDDRL